VGARLPAVLSLSGASIDLVVDVADEATVDDLVRALAGGDVADGTALSVDGRRAGPGTLVADAGLQAGSVLELVTTPPTSPDRFGPAAVAELVVVGGLAAGTAHALGAGRQTVGRSEEADVRVGAPTVSGLHLAVDVSPSGGATVDDLASTNGTRLGGAFVTAPTPVSAADELGVGALAVRVGPVVARGARRRAGPFNRPPRMRPDAPAAPLAAPRRRPSPSSAGGRSRFSWTAFVVPLVSGVVMAVVWDPRLAAFCLLSPVLVVGNWFEDRRRRARDGRDGERALHAELERFQDDVALALDAEAARRARWCPDPIDVVRRATSNADVRLWERRATEAGAFDVRLGVGDERWAPEVDASEREMDDRAATALREATLRHAPITAALTPGSVLGIAGDRRAAVAVARWVVAQLAVHVGPADLRIAVLTAPERTDGWSFAKWLPHAAGLVATTACAADVDAVVGALTATSGVTRLVVVDADGLATGRPAPLRRVLSGGAGPVVGVVLAAHADALPARCTHVVELDGEDGAARLRETHTGRAVDTMLATGLDATAAVELARAIAPVDDPEQRGDRTQLPAAVHLLPLLGLGIGIDDDLDDDLAERWRAAPTDVRAVLGMTERGPLVVDLVRDGPHGLLAGTTGAGKSELLRTFVASLAATASPAHLNVVLVDYKGGSAFDACARLPHTVGVVTDLDEHLGQRALRCLEAELRHRESVLRDAGAVDIAHHQSLAPDRPLPRLVVVVDEFATLATELPDFVDALVGVAQRGRSLGVHLVLATQRPAGAVKDNIRANTNLRIALRVQDAADSNDVIGTPDAAAIARDDRGRGLARLGPSEVVAFQAAFVSGRSTARRAAPVVVRPFPFAPSPATITEPETTGDGPTDLERLVDAASMAAARLGIPAQRRPWPPPLPPIVDLLDVEAAATGVTIGVADDPAGQRQPPWAWDPMRGNLIVYGTTGSGTTTVLETLAVSLARTCGPDELHLYAMDFGAGRLASLAALAHTGAVVGATETERQRRLVRLLRSELDRRRVAPSASPAVVLLVDGWSTFAAAYDDLDGCGVRDELTRIVADGPAVGMWTVVTADRPNAVPLSIAGLVSQRLVLRLADPADWSAFGVGRHDVPPDIAGRGIDAVTGQEVQVALAGSDAWASVRGGTRHAPSIATLPTDVRVRDLAPLPTTSPGDEPWSIPVGVDDGTLATAALVLHPGDHAIVAGPSRSGRSTALLTLLAGAKASRPDVRVVVVAPRRSPLLAMADGSVPRHDGRPPLVVVDDAESVDDHDGAIAALLGAHHPDVHVIAAGRADALRAGYGHWTRELRRSRLGIALLPQVEDGDLFGASFARRALPAATMAGRGVLVVDGVASVVQVARP
jgi:S-DNA-T family DNA segregation ATPase FtsK/SpoIIIE